ncbi:MAG: hypothetical protein PHY59_08815 [Methanobacterium sp.]|nr:hypothetical protein [Methanobacterium sp.]
MSGSQPQLSFDETLIEKLIATVIVIGFAASVIAVIIYLFCIITTSSELVDLKKYNPIPKKSLGMGGV